MIQSKIEVETHIQNNWTTTPIYYDMVEIPSGETSAVQVRFVPIFREQMSYGGTKSRKKETSQMSVVFVGVNTYDVVVLADEFNAMLDCFQGSSCIVDIGTPVGSTILDPSGRAMSQYTYKIEEY